MMGDLLLCLMVNFIELRKILLKAGHSFKSSSDTEVILKAFQEYGTSSFQMLNGMFAFGLYDNHKKLLFLCRDRFGIKPLYYYKDQKVFLFGSEIKALKSSFNFRASFNYQALSEYLWFGNPLGDNTFYNEVHEVTPGSFIVIGDDYFSKTKYHSFGSYIDFNMTEDYAIEKLKSLLENSVERQLVSDVPVGVLLSGGIDSSAITALASRHYNSKLKTYCIGFDYNKQNNEFNLSSIVAKRFNTDHREIFITGERLADVIENLVNAHDEPFADAANIPLYLISRELSGEVKVVLQGDGGDELFGGYSRYRTVMEINNWKLLSHVSILLKNYGTLNTRMLRFKRFLNAITENTPFKRNALLLTMESRSFPPISVLNQDLQRELININPFRRYQEVYASYPKNIESIDSLFLTDMQIILKDTFLEKVDKSVMANSLEVRVPFLDNELAEFVLSIPGNLKVKGGNQKYLLKKALNSILPREVINGRKKGFGVPYDYWLKTSLSDFFFFQINSRKATHFFDIDLINRLYDLHRKGKGNYGFMLWKVLILSVWLNKNDDFAFSKNW